MRPLRLLVSLATGLVAITLILYLAFGSRDEENVHNSVTRPKQSKLQALFSFTSPGSLFPPSAIISLTDDNSTFFLARPAAFGPMLPSKGLSGALWIGSGFGDESMGRGELGCSDVPGWNEGESFVPGSKGTKDAQTQSNGNLGSEMERTEGIPVKRMQDNDHAEVEIMAAENDGTDDHLHTPLAVTPGSGSYNGKIPEHADIQSLQESAEIAGKVVLLKRGGCGFLEKVKWAQSRGGVALIVGDDVRGGALVRMYAHGDTSNVTIPALFTSHTTAHLLSSLLPSGGFLHNLTPEDVESLQRIKGGKVGNTGIQADKADKNQDSGRLYTPTQSALAATRTPRATRKAAAEVGSSHDHDNFDDDGWFRSFLYALGFGRPGRTSSTGVSRRPPSSGNIDWVLVEDWDEDQYGRKLVQSKAPTGNPPTTVPVSDDFVIGEQDWRDPDLLPKQTSNAKPKASTQPAKEAGSDLKGGSVLPGSGEYSSNDELLSSQERSQNKDGHHNSWFGNWLSGGTDGTSEPDLYPTDGSDSVPSTETSSNAHSGDDEAPPSLPEPPHEGLWVTLTPTTMSSSPFIDTLLVLVVSPLVTLTVVYALLLLRSRIRRRRWRAPKSVVERLPVRTYHTISDSSSSPSATPAASSPTTPLLQHGTSRPTSSQSRPRAWTTPEVPATSSSYQQQQSGRTPEEEKREAGLAEWRRRYGGRQKECVVCLEEYVDGVSRVMSLPCGHEFHEDCITPWLVTRRRTCPICKGDVVRSLSQSYRNRNINSPSPTRSTRFFDDDSDSLQAQAAETRNDSSSASLPVPVPSMSGGFPDVPSADVEANWDDDAEDNEDRGREIPRNRVADLSSSMRDLSSTVTTTIWRGFEAIRDATGLQRQPDREEVDRDR